MQDIEQAMIRRIRGSGKGWCFTPSDFADLGGSAAVWTALHRLTQRGIIRRLTQGLYDFWVCWLLRLIFADPELGGHLVFKGGTSLSKVFGIIQRFASLPGLVGSRSRLWSRAGWHALQAPENRPHIFGTLEKTIHTNLKALNYGG